MPSVNATLPDIDNKTNITDLLREDQDGFSWDPTVSVVFTVLCVIIVVLGLCGNCLVVIVVLRNRQMRSVTNILILNLAVADILYITICVPSYAWNVVQMHWPFGDALCRLVQYMTVVSANASIYTLVLMALARFLAVTYPLTCKSICTKRNTYITIAFKWLVSLGASSPLLFVFEEGMMHSDNEDIKDCIIDAEHLFSFLLCFFFLSYVIPLGIILVLYIGMLKHLKTGGIPDMGQNEGSARSKKQATRVMVAAVVVFAVCWCPYHLDRICHMIILSDTSPVIQSVWVVCQILVYINSCVNPILYSFLSDNFRKGFRRAASCSS